MNKMLLLIAFMLALLCSCADDALVSEIPAKKQVIYMAPGRFSEDPVDHYLPSTEFYIDQGQSVKLYLGIQSEGEKALSGNDAAVYFASIHWTLENEVFNIPVFSYSFTESGKHTGQLQTVDAMGDTIRTPFTVYVNTPSSIKLEYPPNGYNLVEPQENPATPLRWSTQGIDEWETALCRVYLSQNRDSIWNSSLGSVNCSGEIFLKGPLIKDTNFIKDSSVTLYWAVKMTVQDGVKPDMYDSTEIFHFSTKITNRDSSTLTIPYRHVNCKKDLEAQTEMVLIQANGDTIKTFLNSDLNGAVTTKVKPQSGLKVILREKKLQEYAPESLLVDVPQGTQITLDTLQLLDRVKPQIALVTPAISDQGVLKFNIYDNGSGLNVSRIKATVGADTVSVLPAGETDFYFAGPCTSICRINVFGEDMAHNTLPAVYWVATSKKDSVYIQGPFPKED